jgi:hypothetical protein
MLLLTLSSGTECLNSPNAKPLNSNIRMPLPIDQFVQKYRLSANENILS